MKKPKSKKCKQCLRKLYSSYSYCSTCRPKLTSYEKFLILHYDYSEDTILETRKGLRSIYKTLDKLS